MPSSRSHRRKAFVLALAGIALLTVAGFVVGDWPALMARYHAWRIDQAETYEAAQPWLEAFHATAKNHRASTAFVDGFRRGREHLLTWFFAWLERTEQPEPALLEAFEKRLRRDETLLAEWSQFVRWRRGSELWSYLSSISPREEEDANEDGTRAFPCGMDSSGLRVLRMVDSSLLETNDPPRSTQPHQRFCTLGIAWFAGMWPLPTGDDLEAALESWMQALKPFTRGSIYDERLGRCKRDAESLPLPEIGRFMPKGAPVPSKPLSTWQGPAPVLPESEPGNEILFLPNSMPRQ